MTAKLATVEDLISAVVTDSGAVGDRNIISDASRNPQAGGIQFDCGYLSPYFVTDPERMEVVFENVYILIHEKKIGAKEDLLPLLDQIIKIGKPLLIIAEDVESGALATLVVHKLHGPLQVAAVRAASLGDQRHRVLREIALVTGVVGSSDVPLKDIQISDLGLAKKITIDRNRTVIEGEAKYGPLSFEPAAQSLLRDHPSPSLLSSQL